MSDDNIIQRHKDTAMYINRPVQSMQTLLKYISIGIMSLLYKTIDSKQIVA